MKKFISGVLSAVLLTMPVCAAELSAKYDAATKKYVVSGCVPEAAHNKLVSITVISDILGTKGWVATLRTDDNGRFSESFVFAPAAEGGDYTVSAGIYEQGVVKTAPLFYVTEGEKTSALVAVNDAVDAINAAITEEELEDAYADLDEAIKDNAVYLGVNITLYNSLGDAKADVLKALAEGEYTEPEEFIIALEKNTAYALIENADKTNITEIIDGYFSIFELQKSELYDEFLTLDKTLVYAKMAGEKCENDADVKAAFDVAVALTLINNTTKWNDFKTILDTYIEYTGINTEYYDRCDKAELAAAICDEDYSSKKELYDAIKAYYDSLNNQNNNSGSGTNGGGGGSGGGSLGSANLGLTLSGIGEKPSQSEAVKEKLLYSDMNDFKWADTAVTVLTEKGIISGDGTGRFNPAIFITREEFVKMLLPALGLYIEGEASNFLDVDKTDWAYPYISCAYELGIVKGMENNSFGYGMKITRQDMTVLIERAATLAGIEFVKTKETKLLDADTVSDYAKDSVIRMTEAGIINGYEDGNFRPMSEATRAEAAVMIYRLLGR